MNIALISLYLLVQIGIGYYISKKVENESDFFLGGRNIPTWALSFSIFATWFGAETCIGSSAAVFQFGLSGSKAEPIGYGMCLFLMGFFVAPKLWNHKYMTLGDFYKDRFGVSTERLAVFIFVPSSLMWAAAQVRAFGQVISQFSTVSLSAAILFATIFVITYTFLGGLMGDIVTDVIQGAILAISLVAIFYFAIRDLGGFSEAFSGIEPSRFSLLSPKQQIFERFDSWMIPIMGSLMSQELIARVLAAQNVPMARKSSYFGCMLYVVFGSIPVLLGLIGYKFGFQFSGEHYEQFLPALSKKILPNFMYVIFVGSLISAILSTIDSILLAVSALIVHNVIIPKFEITEPKKKLAAARSVIVICGLVAYVIAMYTESVYNLVEEASAFGTSGTLVIALMGLTYKFAGSWTANWTMIFGLACSIFFKYVFKLPAAFTIGLVFTLIFYIVLGQIEERRRALNN